MKNIVRLLRLSEEFDLSQDELAKAVGFSRPRITLVEKGGTPSAELMLRLAIFFNKDPREIWSTDFVVSTIQEVKNKRKRKIEDVRNG